MELNDNELGKAINYLEAGFSHCSEQIIFQLYSQCCTIAYEKGVDIDDFFAACLRKARVAAIILKDKGEKGWS